jgi:hypothetical protein
MYRTIISIDAYKDKTVANFFDNGITKDNLFEYLMNWEYGEGDETDVEPWGTADNTYQYSDSDSDYMLVVNLNIEYVMLVAMEDVK